MELLRCAIVCPYLLYHFSYQQLTVNMFLMGQTRPLFVYIRPFLNTMTNIPQIL